MVMGELFLKCLPLPFEFILGAEETFVLLS